MSYEITEDQKRELIATLQTIDHYIGTRQSFLARKQIKEMVAKVNAIPKMKPKEAVGSGSDENGKKAIQV